MRVFVLFFVLLGCVSCNNNYGNERPFIISQTQPDEMDAPNATPKSESGPRHNLGI